MVKQELRVTMTRFQGPIPSPDALAAYESLQPGAADRMIAMAEREQQHRFDMERIEAQAPFIAARRGQLLGFLIAAIVIGCSLVMVLTGHEVTGGILGALDLIGLATLFVMSGAGGLRHGRPEPEAEAHSPSAEPDSEASPEQP